MRWPVGNIRPLAPNGAALEKLRRQILLGEFVSGDRLPPERQLSDELGVARATLREALRSLENEGWLTTRPGKGGGAFIVELKALQDLAMLRFHREPGTIYRAVEYLLITLPAASGLASSRRTVVHLNQMESSVERLNARLTAGEYYREKTQFLIAILNASGNPWLAASGADALATLFLPDELGSSQDRATTRESREALLAAIRARNVRGAEETMRIVADYELTRLPELTRT